MSLRVRIMMMGVLAVIGIVSVLIWRVGEELRSIAASKAVMADAQVAEQLAEVVHELQKERGLSAGYIAGDEGVSPLLAVQRSHSDRRLEALGQDVYRIAARLNDLEATRQTISSRAVGPEVSFAYYSATIQEVLLGIEAIARKTTTLELQDRLFAHAHFLFAKEYVGQMRATLMEALAKRMLDNEMIARLGRLQGQVETNKLAAIKHASPELAEKISVAFGDKNVQMALATVGESIRAPAVVIDRIGTGQWYALATAAIDKLKDVERETLNAIRQRTVQDANEAEWRLIIAAAGTTAFAIFFAWLAISSTLRILRALDILLFGIERVVATRDFGHRIPSYSYDEVGHITHSFNELLDIAESLISEKDAIASNDPLTGSFNRYKFRELFDRALQHEKRYRGGMALIFLDVDYFKSVNDEHGHGVGDSVLMELTRLIRSQIRATDVFARWGGEEFVILVPQGGADAAQTIAENIRKTIEANEFPTVGRMTVSLGITAYVEGDSLESLCQRADYALYHAKEEGRNRCCMRLAPERLDAGLALADQAK